MHLPDHLRANGNRWASEGPQVSFNAEPDLRVVLVDHLGKHVEKIDNPETVQWIAAVLTAAVKWGHSRSASPVSKANASRELLKALAGETQP